MRQVNHLTTATNIMLPNRSLHINYDTFASQKCTQFKCGLQMESAPV